MLLWSLRFPFCCNRLSLCCCWWVVENGVRRGGRGVPLSKNAQWHVSGNVRECSASSSTVSSCARLIEDRHSSCSTSFFCGLHATFLLKFFDVLRSVFSSDCWKTSPYLRNLTVPMELVDCTITPCVFLFRRILWIALLLRHYSWITQLFQVACFLRAHVWCESHISVVFDVLLSVWSTTKYTSVPGCFDLREHVCDRPCWAIDFSNVNCFITNSMSSVSEDTLSLLRERNFGRLFCGWL